MSQPCRDAFQAELPCERGNCLIVQTKAAEILQIAETLWDFQRLHSIVRKAQTKGGQLGEGCDDFEYGKGRLQRCLQEDVEVPQMWTPMQSVQVAFLKVRPVVMDPQRQVELSELAHCEKYMAKPARIWDLVDFGGFVGDVGAAWPLALHLQMLDSTSAHHQPLQCLRSRVQRAVSHDS